VCRVVGQALLRSAGILEGLGAEEKRREALARSVLRLQEATRQDPKDARAFAMLGQALSRDGRRDESNVALDRALLMDPDDADVHYVRGEVFLRTERFAAAIVAFRATIRLAPNSSPPRRALSHALWELDAHDEAIEQLRMATALSPGSLEAHHDLGFSLEKAGDWDGAIAAYRDSLSLFPTEKTLGNLGALLVRKRTFKEGAEILRAALRLNADAAQTWHLLGVALICMRQHGEAIPALRKALSLGFHEPEIMEALDALLRSFVQQQRMKVPGKTYTPCYSLQKQ